jgi:ketosteroid isomerase-like protein
MVLFTMTVLSGTAFAALRPAEESLAAAEREFAAAGLRDGVQKSFLAHFADDATVLKPFAVAAPEFYRTHADGPGKLYWAPQYVAVSAAGDLGLSSGPWRAEGERDGKPVAAHGHFFSIWRRNGQGRWQVAFDHGIGHRPGPTTVEATALVALKTAAIAPPAKGAEARRAALAAADDALRAALALDPRNGYAKFAGADTLWLRDGLLPLQAARPPPAASGAATPACGCGPRVRIGIASSADFGFTIGGRDDAPGKGADVRVWRFDAGKGWRLLADMTTAAP